MAPNFPVVEVQAVPGQCPVCQHPPIRHVSDGTGTTCIICAFLAAQEPWKVNHKICTLKFEFKLSLREREQAEIADKGSWPQTQLCAECDCEWRAHHGYLCPTGDSTFVPLLDKDLPFIHGEMA
jgi:hypothetical protein